MLAAASAWSQGSSGATDPDADPDIQLGRSIYLQGMGEGGSLIRGERSARMVSGFEIACVNCHRQSAMGQVEADVLIPPISGNFLFAKPGDKRIATMDPRVSKLFNPTHPPYTDEELGSAIRKGMNNRGMVMKPVMPRYEFTDKEILALKAYLTTVSRDWSPGVTQSNIRFATVITPDVDEDRRAVFKTMMQSIVRQKNGSTVPASTNQTRTRHHMVSAAEMVLGTERTWELDIWELSGPPSTWAEQLQRFYEKKPVFALVSGLGNSAWQPVHDFCESNRVPCWFPSVVLPGAETSTYNFYFSAGVRLEAQLLAAYLKGQTRKTRKVLQVIEEGAAGGEAARIFRDAMQSGATTFAQYSVQAGKVDVSSLQKEISTLGKQDAVIFWLRNAELRVIQKAIKPPASSVFISAELNKTEAAEMKPGWRDRTAMIYPFALPENRKRNLEYMQVWLNTQHIALIDEPMQSEVFFAMNFMTDTLAEMLDNIYRDYLIERGETMLAQREGVKSEQETRDRIFLGSKDDLANKFGRRQVQDESLRVKLTDRKDMAAPSKGTTMYENLSLAPGQRFANKGGYIVGFGKDGKLKALSGWLVP